MTSQNISKIIKAKSFNQLTASQSPSTGAQDYLRDSLFAYAPLSLRGQGASKKEG
jgi:hypothetical protein